MALKYKKTTNFDLLDGIDIKNSVYVASSFNVSQGNNCTFNVSQGNNSQLLHNSNNCYTALFVSLMYAFSRIQADILISKNQLLQILYLKHHNNEYKTS